MMDNQKIIELMQQAGTDSSGKWMGVDNAKRFAELVIEAYNKEQADPRNTTILD